MGCRRCKCERHQDVSWLWRIIMVINDAICSPVQTVPPIGDMRPIYCVYIHNNDVLYEMHHILVLSLTMYGTNHEKLRKTHPNDWSRQAFPAYVGISRYTCAVAQRSTAYDKLVYIPHETVSMQKLENGSLLARLLKRFWMANLSHQLASFQGSFSFYRKMFKHVLLAYVHFPSPYPAWRMVWPACSIVFTI